MKSVVSKTCLLLLAPALILGPGACGDFDADESFRWGTGQRIDVEQTIQDLIQTGGGWAGNRVNGTLHVAVIDALTRTPIAGADLFFGVPNNNVHHMVTDANGRVEWDPDPGFCRAPSPPASTSSPFARNPSAAMPESAASLST
ncbi:MAG: hypothetical protein ACYTHN_20865 [Planctomycetota bacterium]